MNGLHLVANLYGCRGDARYLTDREAVRQLCIGAVQNSGLTSLGDLFHQFEGESEDAGGVTGAIVLAESHLAIHTWPELNSVTLDVYVCNYTKDNSAKAHSVLRELMAAFDATDYVRHDVPRDLQHLYEHLNGDYGFFVRSTKRLEEFHTGLQKLEVHETPQFGKLLRLDECFQTSEREEFVYHENLIHPSLTAHPSPKQVLIIGGGDGGAVEETLKHPSVERVTMVELDGKVVETAPGSAISGDPWNSLTQLSELLDSRGLALPAGSLVLAGAATQAVALAPGNEVRLDTGVLPAVAFRVES